MAHHQLKTLPAYYEAALDGIKPFEIRDNRDRGFQKGDTVELMEWEPGVVTGSYTGRILKVTITYVTNFEQKEGWVVFGHKKRK